MALAVFVQASWALGALMPAHFPISSTLTW